MSTKGAGNDQSSTARPVQQTGAAGPSNPRGQGWQSLEAKMIALATNYFKQRADESNTLFTQAMNLYQARRATAVQGLETTLHETKQQQRSLEDAIDDFIDDTDGVRTTLEQKIESAAADYQALKAKIDNLKSNPRQAFKDFKKGCL